MTHGDLLRDLLGPLLLRRAEVDFLWRSCRLTHADLLCKPSLPTLIAGRGAGRWYLPLRTAEILQTARKISSPQCRKRRMDAIRAEEGCSPDSLSRWAGFGQRGGGGRTAARCQRGGAPKHSAAPYRSLDRQRYPPFPTTFRTFPGGVLRQLHKEVKPGEIRRLAAAAPQLQGPGVWKAGPSDQGQTLLTVKGNPPST